jgi:hypothetical protein
MTALAITGMGLTGVLRLTRVHDNLAHVLDYSQADETSGTWTGLACPSHGLALGADVDNAVLEEMPSGANSPTSSGKLRTSSPPITPRRSGMPCALTSPATPSAPTGSGSTSGPSGHTPGQRTTRCSSSCRARA